MIDVAGRPANPDRHIPSPWRVIEMIDNIL
jgi:hypothetical protein